MQHGRIFIRSRDALLEFMWARMAKDGSMLMGLTGQGEGAIELVLDPHLGELKVEDMVAPKDVGAMKISFHASGHYKLSGHMGRSENAVDRITVTGPRLDEIIEPRLMAEILLPEKLPVAKRKPSDHDIVLDITEGLPPPHRCAISCMSVECFEKFVASNELVVDTSLWESTNAFTNGPQVWTWTFRKSRNDKQIPKRFLFFLPGFPKWGQAPNAGI